jgi:hypothetical protein
LPAGARRSYDSGQPVYASARKRLPASDSTTE